MRISDWSSDVCSSDLPVLANWQARIDYLTARLAHQTIESVRVLHLNTRNILIRDEEMSRGSIDESAVYVREVIRRAIELGSAALILVHNYPARYPTGMHGHA